MIEFSVTSGLGDAYANFIRQLALSGSSSWKIIGYKVGSNSNLMTIPGLVTDGLKINSMLSALKFHASETIEQDFLIEEFTIKDLRDSFKSKNFEVSGDFNVVYQDGFENTILTVAYRLGQGIYSSSENKNFLTAKASSNSSVSMDGFIFTATRHSDITIKTSVTKNANSDLVSVTSSDEGAVLEVIEQCINVLSGHSILN